MFPSEDVAMPLTEEAVCDTADLLVPITPLHDPGAKKTRGVSIIPSFFTIK
jgi:hypothetical protein